MASEQLNLLAIVPGSLSWAHEGDACDRCADGQFYMVHPSDSCACSAHPCICVAEGYAKCDACGALRQVWPREMISSLAVSEDVNAA